MKWSFCVLRGAWNRLAVSIPVLSTFLAAQLAVSPLQAQQNADDSTVIYGADYFEQYNPVTAQDMLNRIPGLVSPTGGGFGGGGGGRGLGGGGGDQLLINGKRVAGKDNAASDQLSRISAEQVRHFEIIRGTSAALDVRGSNQVVNVVLHEALSSSTLSWEANADHYHDDHVQPGGRLAWNYQGPALTAVSSLSAEPRHEYRVTNETSVQGDYSPNDRIRETRTRDQTDYTLSTNLGYTINEASSARLNLLYRQNDDPTEVRREITDLTGPSPVLTVEREDIPGEQSNWEVGGDYQYNLANGDRFKLLFIANRANDDSVRERYAAVGGAEEEKELFIDSRSIEEERIVRTSWTTGLGERQDIEAGVERAWTGLDSSLRVGRASGSGEPSSAYGGLVPVELGIADSTVEETRYEPFLIHNWQISPRMSVESTLVYEASELTQSGDVFKSRDFGFLKPRIDWRFNVSPALQLRASARKVVLQLRFSDFVATRDDRDDDSAALAGNSELSPEQVHLYDMRFEYRLPGDAGVLDGRFYWMKHYDVIERMDATPNQPEPTSVAGNIGDGPMYGFTLNGSVRMTPLNLPGLLLTSSLEVKDSEITDPFLGIERRFERHERGRLQLGFRHDMSTRPISYGLNWNNRFDGNMKRYDVDNLERYEGEPMVTAFAEVVAFDGIRFRLDARNLTSNLQCRERTRYQGRITSGVINEIENMCSTWGTVVALKISGTL